MSYHAFFTYEHAHQIETWQSATGEDLWSDFIGLDGEGAFQLYATLPHDRSWVGVADIGGRDSFSEANASYLVLTQRRRRDGVAKYWTNYLKEEAKRRKANGGRHVRVGSSWWPYLLWYDPSVPTVVPESLPPARLFNGVGWAAMRSDWSPGATYALFVCAPIWLGGHQHADNNSFVIHKNGLLALDSGVYDAGPHRANYYARSIAHNTVTVTDPNETFNAGTWGSGRSGEGANDGGQLYTGAPYLVSDVTPGGEYHRGKIVAYENTDEFTYVVGDATRSYSPDKLTEFTRGFLFVRPDLFVVFDRVEATDAAFAKKWLIHSATEPQLNGAAFTIRDTLTAHTVFPQDAARQVIGGPGHEFETDGRNYPSTKEYDADEAGRWRVEVEQVEKAKRQYFLHVLSLDPAGVEIESEESADALGATISMSDGSVRVSFAKEGAFSGSLEILDADGEPVVQQRRLAAEIIR